MESADVYRFYRWQRGSCNMARTSVGALQQFLNQVEWVRRLPAGRFASSRRRAPNAEPGHCVVWSGDSYYRRIVALEDVERGMAMFDKVWTCWRSGEYELLPMPQLRQRHEIFGRGGGQAALTGSRCLGRSASLGAFVRREIRVNPLLSILSMSRCSLPAGLVEGCACWRHD